MPQRLLSVSFEEDESRAVKLVVDLAIGLGGDLWPATHHFCRFITSYSDRSFFHRIFDNRSVIELGSGTGLTGLFIEKYFTPQTIIVSDLASHMELMQRNMSLNESKLCKVLEIDWCSPPQDGMKYDVIIALEWYSAYILMIP